MIRPPVTDPKQKTALIRLKVWSQKANSFQLRRKIDELLPKYEAVEPGHPYYNLLYFGLLLLHDRLDKKERFLQSAKTSKQALNDFSSKGGDSNVI